MIELDYTVDIILQAATFFLDRVKSPLVSILSDSFVSSSLMQAELAFFLMNILCLTFFFLRQEVFTVNNTML